MIVGKAEVPRIETLKLDEYLLCLELEVESYH